MAADDPRQAMRRPYSIADASGRATPPLLDIVLLAWRGLAQRPAIHMLAP